MLEGRANRTLAYTAAFIMLCGCEARLRPVDKDVYYVEGTGGASNQLIVNTDFGPVVVDARLDPYLTDDLNKRVQTTTNWEDAAYVINTSGLPYRWLTNYRFPKAEIIASVRTHRFMAENAADFIKETLSRDDLPAWAAEVNPVFPTMDFEDRLVLRTPGLRIIIMEQPPAVVPGNSVVYIPEKGILYGGDIIAAGTAPILRYADPAAWIEALEKLRRLPIRIVVPGFGRRAQASLIDEVIAAVKALEIYEGGSIPPEIANLWSEDPTLANKLKEFVSARSKEEARTNK